MLILILSSLIIELSLIAGVIYYIYKNGFTDEAIMGIIVGLIFNLTAIFWGIEYGKNIGRVNGLLESGKYEIVTNDDYSNKELEKFLKINGIYLKELEEK